MKNELTKIINDMRENKGERRLEKIERETNLRKDLGFDSFDLAELTVKIESRFDIDVFESGIVETFGEVVDRLKK